MEYGVMIPNQNLQVPALDSLSSPSANNPAATREIPLLLLRRLFTTYVDVVERHATQIAQSEQPDAETIHDFRIALRRVETVLTQFRPLLPRRECKWFLARFKTLRKASNPLRDADIFLEHLARYHDDGPFNGLKDRVLDGHQSSLTRVQSTCAEWLALPERGEHQARMIDRIDRAIQRHHVEQTEPSTCELSRWIDARLRKLGRRLFRAKANWKGWETLHERRIDAKRLRYALELYREFLPRDDYDAMYRRLKSLQNRLGTMNDEATLAAQLKEMSRSPLTSDPEHAEISTLRCLEKEALRCHLAEFKEWWTPSRRQKWKKQWKDLLDKFKETA